MAALGLIRLALKRPPTPLAICHKDASHLLPWPPCALTFSHPSLLSSPSRSYRLGLLFTRFARLGSPGSNAGIHEPETGCSTLAVACYTGRLTFGTVVATVVALWRATPHSERAPRPARRSPSSRRHPD
ncbi:hypothetical protein C8J57DRAFT_1232215 [Mycena rebaudengoi]|nr:hypothetical protein C8J57DRAFT_1232215 [Mycena rebaudengoi]